MFSHCLYLSAAMDDQKTDSSEDDSHKIPVDKV